jgi:magnesium chelatase family protein
LGHPEKNCRCSAASLERYRDRISGPLLDRIDVLIDVPPLREDGLGDRVPIETSQAIRRRVLAARAFREERRMRPGGGGVGVGRGDEDSPQSVLEREGPLSLEARALLRQALRCEGLSGRGFVRVVGVARTIADLDAHLTIEVEHLAEALSLRLDSGRLGMA